MDQAKKNKTARALAFLVSAAGLLVMAGWVLDIGFLKSVSPAWIPMKFSTAFAFLLSGVLLYFITGAEEGKQDAAQVVLPAATLTLLLLMGILFFSALLGVHTGLEDLFVRETSGAVMTVVPGRPSLPTMVCFLLTALGGILAMFNHRKLKKGLKVIGLAVGLIGALAAAGYLFRAPLVYYFVPGINSAMAFNTAALFILLGTGFLCLSE